MASTIKKEPAFVAEQIAPWLNLNQVIPTYSVLGNIQQGQLWQFDGNSKKLLIVSILSGRVYFLQGNDLYSQQSKEFVDEIMFSSIVAAGGKLKPLAYNLELAARFGLGVVVTMNGLAFGAFITIEITSFVVRNKDKIPIWAAAIWAISKCLATIKLWWPAMYAVIEKTVLSEIIKRIPANISLEDAVFCAGQIMAVAFKRDLKTFTEVIVSLLEIMSKCLVLAIKTIPAATAAITANGNLAIKDLIREFQNIGVSITTSEATDIFNQFRSNQTILDLSMRNLLYELSKLK